MITLRIKRLMCYMNSTNPLKNRANFLFKDFHTFKSIISFNDNREFIRAIISVSFLSFSLSFSSTLFEMEEV